MVLMMMVELMVMAVATTAVEVVALWFS